MKKWMYLFSVFFVMTFAVMISENTAFAQDRTDFNIQDGNLTKYAGTTANVEIPDDVVTIGADVFKNQKNITSVVIPQGVTTIEKAAFYGCTSLQSVVLPDSVTYLGEQAFYGCKSLNSVTLSKSLTSISKQAFYNCSNLLSISIPGNCTSIGSSAFSGCKNIGNIELGYGIQDIGEKAFQGNDKVVSVVIPDSVTNIGKYAFESCDNLQDVTLSKSLTILPSKIFEFCKKMEKLSIPEGVQNLENGILYGCSNLKYLAIPDSVTSIEKLSSGATPNKNLTIYCNRDTAAFYYAVNNDIFYKPLENYAIDSGNSSSVDTNTGTNIGTNTGTNIGSDNEITDTNINSGAAGNTTPDVDINTPVQTEKAVLRAECINTKCVRVYFTDGTSGIYDVPEMEAGKDNTVTIQEGGKEYQCNVAIGLLNVTVIIDSIQAISPNKVQMKYSQDFIRNRNGIEVIPEFVIPGWSFSYTSVDHDNKIIELKSNVMTTKQDTLYTVQAIYDGGIVFFNQDSFYGYEAAVSEPVQTPSTGSDISNDPTIWDPVEDTSIPTDSSNIGSGSSSDNNFQNNDSSNIGSGSSSNNNFQNDTSSGTGWDNSYKDYEEPVVQNPKLSTKSKTIKKGKTFTLRLKNTTSNAKWTISNKKVGKIVYKTGKSIKIKGAKKGKTYITAYVKGKTLKCKVTVK